MKKYLVALAFAFGLAGSAYVATAQEKGDAQRAQSEKIDPPKAAEEKAGDLKKEEPVPPATTRHPSEQAGTQEGSSKVKGTHPNPNVLEKGVLTAPGARTDVDTAPAKFTTRTDRDDQLPIAAYRLKHLTGDQRRDIAGQLGASGSKPTADIAAKVGAEMPAAVLTAFAPVPEPVAAKFPELRGTGFSRVAGKVVLVDLDNSLVIGVIEG